MRDLRKELEDWTDWPPAWKPEPGDVLVGTVERYDIGQTMYGPVRTCTVKTDQGERLAIWLSTTVLLDQFRRERPKPGERIGVKYLGKHPEHGYHRYRLIVDRPQQEADFAPLGGEARIEGEPW